jgi:hypothetical protein
MKIKKYLEYTHFPNMFITIFHTSTTFSFIQYGYSSLVAELIILRSYHGATVFWDVASCNVIQV